MKSRQSVPPTEFYGQAAAHAAQRAQVRAQKRRAAALPDEQQFFRQAQAFAAADEAVLASDAGQGWPAPRVLALECAASGSRKFSVVGRRDFMRYYLGCKPTARHVYEIIREDAPCRLYFDLEFKRKENPAVDGEALVRLVIGATAALLFSDFRITLRRADVLELDSSSPTKFSRHLIVHLPNGALFPNNRVCGRFVRQVVEYTREELAVRTESGALTSFVDLGVYTRNRAFRLYLSSKFGKREILEPAEGNSFPCSDSTAEGITQLLEDSFVCPAHVDQAQLLVMEEEEGGDSASAPLVDQRKPPRAAQLYGEPLSLSAAEQFSGGLGFRANTSLGGALVTSSEFPREERAMLSHAARSGSSSGCPPPSVRSWQVLRDTDGKPLTLTLHFQRHRFCHRIGRAHRSNNVFYVFDFETNTFVQRCFDPDCKLFTSNRWTLELEEGKSAA